MRLRALALRREALVAKSAGQRAGIAAQLAPAARVLAVADRAIAAVRAHPLPFALAAGALALRGRRSLLRIAARAVPLYALLRRLT